MSTQYWVGPLITSQIDGATLSNTITATSIIPAAARFTIPSNFFDTIGKMIRVRATGRISTVVTTPGNITFDVRLGTVASPIVAFNAGASALNIIAQTNATWDFEALLTVRAIGNGTAANLIGVSKWTSRASLNNPIVATTTGVGTVLGPDTAPAVGTGWDSTITNVLDFFATWSIANAANSLICHQYSVESVL